MLCSALAQARGATVQPHLYSLDSDLDQTIRGSERLVLRYCRRSPAGTATADHTIRRRCRKLLLG
jgi:hypothetical protein